MNKWDIIRVQMIGRLMDEESNGYDQILALCVLLNRLGI